MGVFSFMVLMLDREHKGKNLPSLQSLAVEKRKDGASG